MNMNKGMTMEEANSIAETVSTNIMDINVGLVRRVDSILGEWKVTTYRVGEMIRIDISPTKGEGK